MSCFFNRHGGRGKKCWVYAPEKANKEGKSEYTDRMEGKREKKEKMYRIALIRARK